MIVYNDQGVAVKALKHSVCITTGPWRIYLSFKELADIADAVRRHLESAAEPFFTEEDLEAGRRAIREIPCPNEWDPLAQGGDRGHVLDRG